MKGRVLTYLDIMEISDRAQKKMMGRYNRRVKMQNFAAKYGWQFWIQIFNLLKY